jgi:hypothetical protein
VNRVKNRRRVASDGAACTGFIGINGESTQSEKSGKPARAAKPASRRLSDWQAAQNAQTLNDECLMTKEARMTNALRNPLATRHSCFVIL